MGNRVVSSATLLEMAEKCSRVSKQRQGMPTLDDAAELLEVAAFRVTELEDENRKLYIAINWVRAAISSVAT